MRQLANGKRTVIATTVLCAALCCALLLSSLIQAADSPTSSRVLGIDGEQTDFGYAPQYAKLSRVYWVKPAGDDTLRIHHVIPGCGCTEVPVDKEVIPPGDSARLELIFDSKRYRGALSRRPQIQFKGELFPHLITFYAYILGDRDEMAPVNVTPRTLDIPPGATATQLQITIDNGAEEDIFLSLAHRQTEFYTVNLPEKIPQGKQAVVNIDLHPSAQSKKFENSFTFQADYADGRKVSRHTVPVRYQVIPDSTLTDTLESNTADAE